MNDQLSGYLCGWVVVVTNQRFLHLTLMQPVSSADAVALSKYCIYQKEKKEEEEDVFAVSGPFISR